MFGLQEADRDWNMSVLCLVIGASLNKQIQEGWCSHALWWCALRLRTSRLRRLSRWPPQWIWRRRMSEANRQGKRGNGLGIETWRLQYSGWCRVDERRCAARLVSNQPVHESTCSWPTTTHLQILCEGMCNFKINELEFVIRLYNLDLAGFASFDVLRRHSLWLLVFRRVLLTWSIADAEVGRVSLVPTWRLDVWHWATTDANNLNSGWWRSLMVEQLLASTDSDTVPTNLTLVVSIYLVPWVKLQTTLRAFDSEYFSINHQLLRIVNARLHWLHPDQKAKWHLLCKEWLPLHYDMLLWCPSQPSPA